MPLGFILILVVFLAPARAVELGIDRFQEVGFAPFVGNRGGLITNHTGVDSRGVTTRFILQAERGAYLLY